jgi:LUD domain
MNDFSENYWKKRIETCVKALEKNNFDVFVAKDPAEANHIILEDILPAAGAKTVSWGDSMTLHATGVMAVIRENPDIELIETFAADVPREEIIERRRRALLVDLFFTGTNALTESGKLVNLDMVGNRVAGVIFGPKNVVITVGRNKLVSGSEIGDQAALRGRILFSSFWYRLSDSHRSRAC